MTKMARATDQERARYAKTKYRPVTRPRSLTDWTLHHPAFARLVANVTVPGEGIQPQRRAKVRA